MFKCSSGTVCGKIARAKISAYFVEHTNDLEMIEQLKKLIQEKEKELK